jgi:cell shape-determining protein MreD
MPKQKTKTVIKLLIIIPYLLLLYILQSMVLPHTSILGVKPLIFPLAVVGVSLFSGRVSGGMMGIICGMLCDLSFNQPTIQFTILLALVGIFFGMLSDTVLVQGFPSYLACSFGALVICSVCQMFQMIFFHGATFSALLDVCIRQTLASLLFTIPLYYSSRFISRLM